MFLVGKIAAASTVAMGLGGYLAWLLPVAPPRFVAVAAGVVSGSSASVVVAGGALAAMTGVILSQILGVRRMVFAMSRAGDAPAVLEVITARGVPARKPGLTGRPYFRSYSTAFDVLTRGSPMASRVKRTMRKAKKAARKAKRGKKALRLRRLLPRPVPTATDREHHPGTEDAPWVKATSFSIA